MTPVHGPDTAGFTNDACMSPCVVDRLEYAPTKHIDRGHVGAQASWDRQGRSRPVFAMARRTKFEWGSAARWSISLRPCTPDTRSRKDLRAISA
jgi:hypothetical protein